MCSVLRKLKQAPLTPYPPAFLSGRTKASEDSAAGHPHTEGLPGLALSDLLPADAEESDPHLGLVPGQQGAACLLSAMSVITPVAEGYVWLFLTVPMSPTAKEALWEDKVVSTADPGFREGVEGKEVKRGPGPHVASARLSPLPVL